jgi:imidazole glycerol-phosphate synthase subunit HisH
VTSVVILDYGSGNLRSAQRALEHVGADVTVTSDAQVAAEADGLVVPGVGAFAACMQGLRDVHAGRIVDGRLAGGRPVLGICVGMQVLFETGVEHGEVTEGLGEWPGTVERLAADVLPHMGWNTVDAAPGSTMFAGLEGAYFYFVHSYGVRTWEMVSAQESPLTSPRVSWTTYGENFVSGVENGPLWATQFHPEKSGDAGAELLRTWLGTLD